MEGTFNIKNEHFWSGQNPNAVKEMFDFNVFCLQKDNTIALLFHDESLNSDKFLQIQRSVVKDISENLPLEDCSNCWFQLDVAPAHCTGGISTELFEMFNDHWFRHFGP